MPPASGDPDSPDFSHEDASLTATWPDPAPASATEELRKSFREHLQDIHEAARSASATPEDIVVHVSEESDDDAPAARRSKLRKRWLQQATETPPTPPLLNSPGGSSGSATWLLVNAENAEAGVPSGLPSGSTSSFQLSSSQSRPKFPSPGLTSKA